MQNATNSKSLYEDWTAARDYIDIEIEYIQKNRRITNADNIKIETIKLT